MWFSTLYKSLMLLKSGCKCKVDIYVWPWAIMHYRSYTLRWHRSWTISALLSALFFYLPSLHSSSFLVFLSHTLVRSSSFHINMSEIKLEKLYDMFSNWTPTPKPSCLVHTNNFGGGRSGSAPYRGGFSPSCLFPKMDVVHRLFPVNNSLLDCTMDRD